MKLIAILIAAGAIFIVSGQGVNIVSEIRSQITSLTNQATDLLPGGDPYQLGIDEGARIRSDSSYIDQLDIAILPGASGLVNNLKSGLVDEVLLGKIADIYWPVAAVKKGILNIGAENRAEFRRGLIEGYFANEQGNP